MEDGDVQMVVRAPAARDRARPIVLDDNDEEEGDGVEDEEEEDEEEEEKKPTPHRHSTRLQGRHRCFKVHAMDANQSMRIMKMEWNRVGGGAQVDAGRERAEDIIPTNRWLKSVVLPGRVECMRMSLGIGRKPRTGHEEGA
ncbi:Protein transport protein Sec31A [Hordeum vulgare]|nr:Protein transport protein Sec31A [Hordeum vulgare]